MVYRKTQADGYITGFSTSVSGEGNITEEAYNAIVDAVNRLPPAPEGFVYRLRTDLSAELVELPPAPEEPTLYTQQALEGMTNAELADILALFGISANMTKANMVRLILAVQEEGA